MDLKQAIFKIKEVVAKTIFFEFNFYSYSDDKLIIVGSPDLSYYHTLEIHLIEPFYVSSKTRWIADIQKPVQEFEEAELVEFNKRNRIEVGNSSLLFPDEDGLAFCFSFKGIEIIGKVVQY